MNGNLIAIPFEVERFATPRRPFKHISYVSHVIDRCAFVGFLMRTSLQSGRAHAETLKSPFRALTLTLKGTGYLRTSSNRLTGTGPRSERMGVIHVSLSHRTEIFIAVRQVFFHLMLRLSRTKCDSIIHYRHADNDTRLLEVYRLSYRKRARWRPVRMSLFMPFTHGVGVS